MAVCSLFHVANTNLQLRSAFTLGSTGIRGSIYLECQMNKNLLDLLAKTSGIIRTAQGILSKKIDPNEYQNLLHMKAINFNIAVGNWVQIKRGTFRLASIIIEKQIERRICKYRLKLLCCLKPEIEKEVLLLKVRRECGFVYVWENRECGLKRSGRQIASVGKKAFITGNTGIASELWEIQLVFEGHRKAWHIRVLFFYGGRPGRVFR